MEWIRIIRDTFCPGHGNVVVGQELECHGLVARSLRQCGKAVSIDPAKTTAAKAGASKGAPATASAKKKKKAAKKKKN